MNDKWIILLEPKNHMLTFNQNLMHFLSPICIFQKYFYLILITCFNCNGFE